MQSCCTEPLSCPRPRCSGPGLEPSILLQGSRVGHPRDWQVTGASPSPRLVEQAALGAAEGTAVLSDQLPSER